MVRLFCIFLSALKFACFQTNYFIRDILYTIDGRNWYSVPLSLQWGILLNEEHHMRKTTSYTQLIAAYTVLCYAY